MKTQERENKCIGGRRLEAMDRGYYRTIYMLINNCISPSHWASISGTDYFLFTRIKSFAMMLKLLSFLRRLAISKMVIKICWSMESHRQSTELFHQDTLTPCLRKYSLNIVRWPHHTLVFHLVHGMEPKIPNVAPSRSNKLLSIPIRSPKYGRVPCGVRQTRW